MTELARCAARRSSAPPTSSRGEARYERDVTGRFGGPPRRWSAAGLDCAEVAAVLAACTAAGAAVVPQGGNTGLVGGGVPRGGEVVLSLARLTAIGPLDAVARQMTVGAGVTPAALAAALRGTGLALGVDFGARDAATIGGMVATDAGGAQVLRHGTMRARVAGLEAVLADGRVLRRLSGLVKDNAGYDLPELLVGSEGTLAVITAVRLALVDAPAARSSRRCSACGSMAEAVELVARARRRAARALRRGGLRRGGHGARHASTCALPHPLARRAPGLRAAGDGRRRRGAGGGARRRGRRRGGRRHGAARGAVALPRGAQPGGQRRRRAAQARRVGADRRDGGVRGGRAGGGRGARRAGDPLGPPRRRQPARQRARARAGRRARGRGRARAGGRARRLDQRGARRGGGQAALPRPHPHPGGGGGDGGREARARPGRARASLEPAACLLAVPGTLSPGSAPRR